MGRKPREPRPVSLRQTVVVPRYVANTAQEGLALQRRYGRGGTEEELRRGRQLATGHPRVTLHDLIPMRAYFRRNADNRLRHGIGPPSSRHIAWLLQGGNAGWEWVEAMLHSKRITLATGALEDRSETTADDPSPRTAPELLEPLWSPTITAAPGPGLQTTGRWLLAAAQHGPVGRVLDYGCGHGALVRFLRDQGLEADGYDPFFDEWATPPRGTYSVVVLAYVLSIVEREEREPIARHAARLLAPRGLILAETCDDSQAEDDAWVGSAPYRDGHIRCSVEDDDSANLPGVECFFRSAMPLSSLDRTMRAAGLVRDRSIRWFLRDKRPVGAYRHAPR